MSEKEFDIEQALDAISDNFDKNGRDRFEKKQEEKRTALKVTMNSQDSSDLKYLHGMRAIALAEKALKRLNPDTDRFAYLFEMERLAEGYALTGNIEKAFSLTPNPVKQNEYAKLLSALNNDIKCFCKTTTYNTEKGKIQVTPQRFKERVFYNGKKYTIFSCTDCGSSYRV